MNRTTIMLDATMNFSGWPSQKIQIAPGTGQGSAGIANRGLGNEGLFLQKGLEYEGYVFVSTPPSTTAPVTLEVRLENTDGKILASQTILHTPPSSSASSSFVQHTFSLTPSEGTVCVGIPPGSDPSVHCTDTPNNPAHICIKCGGQMTVAVVETSDHSTTDTIAHVAYVVLQPGPWGRFKGLNARKDVAEMLQAMGIKAIRLGYNIISYSLSYCHIHMPSTSS